MHTKLISSLAGAAFSFAASGLAFAADMAVKAPPAPLAAACTWCGWYVGGSMGYGWSHEAVNYAPNDPASAALLSGTVGFGGEQPVANGYRVPHSGIVGGVEAGYNWQAGSNWLLGLEADFNLASLRGTASGTTIFSPGAPVTQASEATQETDRYATVRGRVGWFATPRLLLFGTGGLAYGRIADSANYTMTGNIAFVPGPTGFVCTAGVPCFAGSSSAMRVGWTAGGGTEWLFDSHWSAKIEYQFVDLGTQTVRVTALASLLGFPPASFNAAFHERFNVVRIGLNYHFH